MLLDKSRGGVMPGGGSGGAVWGIYKGNIRNGHAHWQRGVYGYIGWRRANRVGMAAGPTFL